MSYNKSIINYSFENNDSIIPKRENGSFSKYIKTNLYLNNYNYLFKNNIKMNKLREEKLKEKREETEKDRKLNILPKMLYFNKFLNNDKNNSLKKRNNNLNISKIKTNTFKTINVPDSKQMTSENKENDKKIENAIIAKKIEENGKSHIKKTIKLFDELVHYVDKFKLQNKPNISNSRFNIIRDFEKYKSEVFNNNKEEENDDEENEDLDVENFNFDEYKKKYKEDKINKKNEGSQTPIKSLSSQKRIKSNYTSFFRNIENNENKDDSYINTPMHLTETNFNKKKMPINLAKMDKPKESSNNLDINDNKKSEINKFRINNMTLISDDLLVNKIRNVRRDFKEGLHFNNYGKYKFTDLGLNYPEHVDKYKKIPDYKGNDIDEKIVFNYRTKVTNQKYNYSNIGTFNEKFNNDLSDISSYYGKEQSKGRFIRNPLSTMLDSYIPEYEQYKDLKYIENKYNVKNKYKFRLKPLVNNRKNNFDKLAKIVYKQKNKSDFFLI